MGVSLAYSGKYIDALIYCKNAFSMALRISKQETVEVRAYLNNLINTLNKREDQELIQQTKKEVLPLCNQWLGAKHALTQQLRNTGE